MTLGEAPVAIVARSDLTASVRAQITGSDASDLQAIVELVASQLGAPLVALAVLHEEVYRYDVVSGGAPFGNPAPQALCQFATGRGLVEITDASKDPRTAALAAVDGREAAVRYYFSAPVVVRDEEVGRFCVFDMSPRTASPVEREAVRVLADAAGKILDRRLRVAAEDGEDGDAATRLEAAAAARADVDDLVAQAAHDLRSPLVTLAASLELIEDAVGAAPDSITGLLLSKAQGAVTRLNELVLGVLSLHAAQGVIRVVDADEVAAAARDDLDSQVRARNGRIRLEPLGQVHADPGQLHSVLLNLMGNGLKFNRPGVPPEVVVSAEHGRDGATLVVSDQGVGIPVEQREHVFELFARVGDASVAGFGIGLSTVARIVHGHGGSVDIDDGPGGLGTQVRVWLPHQREASAAS
ncbi:hypothetical protein KLP28_11815 [Nocardioidaceae bacterium]|nr:hypothetical protein KLP28_11815 [Nocardioidaceae bacterium]